MRKAKDTYDSSAVGREDVPLGLGVGLKPKKSRSWISGMEYNYGGRC